MQKPIVLITGASQGLGAELARLYAHRAAALVLVARTPEPLLVLQTELAPHLEVLAFPGSVDDDEHVHRVVAAAEAHFGRIDILINNASTLGGSPMPWLEKLGPTAFGTLMDVNVRAPLHIAQHILPGMRARREGKIVNITSDAAVQAYAGWGGYGASKAALEHLSRVLAEELAGSGIGVAVIDPGNMNTQMHRDAEPGEDLSSLPRARSVAPAVLELINAAPAGYARYEAQALVAAV